MEKEKKLLEDYLGATEKVIAHFQNSKSPDEHRDFLSASLVYRSIIEDKLKDMEENKPKLGIKKHTRTIRAETSRQICKSYCDWSNVIAILGYTGCPNPKDETGKNPATTCYLCTQAIVSMGQMTEREAIQCTSIWPSHLLQHFDCIKPFFKLGPVESKYKNSYFLSCKSTNIVNYLRFKGTEGRIATTINNPGMRKCKISTCAFKNSLMIDHLHPNQVQFKIFLHGENIPAPNFTTFTISGEFSCESICVLYGIVCGICGVLVYDGETARVARLRWSRHRAGLTAASQHIHVDSKNEIAKKKKLKKQFEEKFDDKEVQFTMDEYMMMEEEDNRNIKNMKFFVFELAPIDKDERVKREKQITELYSSEIKKTDGYYDGHLDYTPEYDSDGIV